MKVESKLILRVITIGCLGICASASFGSDKKTDVPVQESNSARKEFEGIWPVDTILDTAVRNIAARYNLNDVQTEQTRTMMVTRVKSFLDQHQDDIWPLIRDLTFYQRKGEMPDAQAAAKLGPVAAKILQDAKDEILRSNKEWGEILSDEQRRVHEFDLREMDKTFKAMEQTFQNWQQGEIAQGAIFPTPKKLTNEPPRPARPDDGTLPAAGQPRKGDSANPDDGGTRLLSHFEAYVNKFVEDYELTPPQREAAYSILREVTERASAFQEAHRDELEEIKTRLAQAKSPDERRVITASRRRVTKPLDDLFSELKQRLDQIPEQAQRERFRERARSGQSGRSAIDGAGKTQPAPSANDKEPAPQESENGQEEKPASDDPDRE